MAAETVNTRLNFTVAVDAEENPERVRGWRQSMEEGAPAGCRGERKTTWWLTA